MLLSRKKGMNIPFQCRFMGLSALSDWFRRADRASRRLHTKLIGCRVFRGGYPPECC